ncbi:MAG: acyl-CoA dehydrogenase family protein, partial [Alphaproteobacteria bacterium]|nr:acyl-CoA dehydrogenase family protein [Alphaproteobacteria bacterium]
MQLGLSSEDLAFQAAARDLIGRTFPEGDPFDGGRAHEQRWHAAMAQLGWEINKWPVAFGGPGWSATQHFIWERETTA